MNTPKPLKGLQKILPYAGGESELVGFDKVIKLASNEGAFGPSDNAISALNTSGNEFHRYPDGDCTKLRKLLAEKNKIPYKNIICGAGSDELISLLCRAYAGKGDQILCSSHGFAMYPIYGRTVRAQIVTAPENNITSDVDQLVKHVTEKTKLVFIANPNNPTGTYLPRIEIQRLIDSLPKDVLLVLDSAYSEFCEEEDYSDGSEFVTMNDNVIMLRTFSKIYGLAGLRLGWGYAANNVIDVLNKIRSPFNVSYPAMIAGIASIKDDNFLHMSQQHNNKWLKWSTDEIRNLGLKVPNSYCNFILVRFKETSAKNHSAAEADDFLKSQGIIVRRMAGYGLPDALRISIGLEEEMKTVVTALKEFMDV